MNAQKLMVARQLTIASLTLNVGVAVLFAPAASYGAALKPSGTYSEAKIETRPQGQSQNQKQNKAQATTAADEAKTWVKDKLNAVRGFWDSKPSQQAAKPAPSRAPSAASAAIPRQPSLGNLAPSAGQPAQSAGGATVNPVGERAVNGQSTSGDADSAFAVRGNPQETLSLPGVKQKPSGVVVYDIAAAPVIPRLSIEREETFGKSKFALDTSMQKVMNERVLHPFASPDALKDEDFNRLSKIATGAVVPAESIRDVVFMPKGKISRQAFDEIKPLILPNSDVKLAAFKELSKDEIRFLSGLLLYQQGDKCASAVGLFHTLSKNKAYQSEADYYLAMCSRKVGLETDFMERASRILTKQDVYYSKKILAEIGHNVPYEFIDSLGLALMKASSNTKIMQGIDAATKSNIAYLLTEYGASTGNYKTALSWSKKVADNHPRALQARFLQALSEYQAGSKERALAIQEDLINSLKTDKAKSEFQALVALNVARMYFQEQKFKSAHTSFLKVYKDHPLWLQSLTEMGWSQLMSGDYEGAIGNMYSIQSPFFGAVYKPESYVIRTIGYLNLCQYGDAYRTLSYMEHEYRPYLEKMTSYMTSKKGAYYETVRSFLMTAAAEKNPDNKSKKPAVKEVDGLPVQIVREMARHRDFTNLQKALNRQIDERQIYTQLNTEVAKSLKRAQWLVNNSRKRADELRRNLSISAKKPTMEQSRKDWQAQLETELDQLNGHFFQVDLFNEAKSALAGYRTEVVASAEKRLGTMKSKMEKTLASRIGRMKTDLSRMIENNELLRYEVFAGSGENIRYQVAGGEKGNRVPASVIPKSKSLRWNFDGEYWEDEIGHYRSSLKNNCPESQQREQASLNGGGQ